LKSRDDPVDRDHGIAFSEAVWVWCRIAMMSFGGPAGQIALMHKIIVEEKRWIGDQRFLHALNYCMLLPGPEAQQLATYIGWLLHRTAGGIVAGALFVFPGFISIMLLSYIYVIWGDVSLVDALFFGLKAAVLAIVLEAVVRISKRALKSRAMGLIAAASFFAIFACAVPFPLIILCAGLLGYTGYKLGWAGFDVANVHGQGVSNPLDDADSVLGERVPIHAMPSAGWSFRVSAVALVLWLGPVLLLLFILGGDNVFSEIAVFFSKMAVMTFGGAYAVLAYVAQQAVENYGWLQPSEMIDGLGMAETTPGPLIIVTQFVGFLGAYRDPGGLSPLLAATLGGMLTTWVTFVPCFLWIFLGAPYMESMRQNHTLSAALTAITAAVVGVILNLAVWFAIHFLFTSITSLKAFPLDIELPVINSIQWLPLIFTIAAVIAIFKFSMSAIRVLLLSAGASVLVVLSGTAVS
jgi:chromate transporter